MNTDIFFQRIRKEPFSGRMTQAQVNGVNAILSSWKLTDIRWLAYILATAFHETGARMQPVREGFAASDAAARAYVKRHGYKYAQPDPITGEVYYGRGHVQLTWAKNYRTMGEALDVDLYNEPDRALEPYTSARILMVGMTNGLFTGAKLSDYFNTRKNDPVGARRIVNGTDRAALVAGYYHAFLHAIQAADAEESPEPEESERETEAPWYPERKPLTQSNTMKAQGLTGVGTVGATASEQISDGLSQAQDAASQLSLYLDIAKWACIALVIAGIAWTVWCRYQDYKRGVK